MTEETPRQPNNIVVVPVEIDRGPTHTYQKTDVHVHRAPTDESVRLLKEMEQAARDKIESSVAIGGNGFECTVYITREVMTFSTVATAIFKLNGKQLRAEARVESWEQRGGVDQQEIYMRLRNEMAKVIATEVLVSAMSRLVR